MCNFAYPEDNSKENANKEYKVNRNPYEWADSNSDKSNDKPDYNVWFDAPC